MGNRARLGSVLQQWTDGIRQPLPTGTRSRAVRRSAGARALDCVHAAVVGRAQGEPLVSTVRALQPSVRTGAWSAPGSTGPFVYGTLDTVYNTRRRLGTIVDAIGLGGWSGLVTVGNTMNPGEFAASPLIAIERFVPQTDALERADVMLCHGGLGSVLGAIESGTPMVILPLGADQLVNAEIGRRATTRHHGTAVNKLSARSRQPAGKLLALREWRGGGREMRWPTASGLSAFVLLPRRLGHRGVLDGVFGK